MSGTVYHKSRTRFAAPSEEQAQDWRSAGACTTGDPELWFASTQGDRERAIVICRTCPVMARCRAWATATGESFGVWGGIDVEAEREQAPAIPRDRRGRDRRDVLDRIAEAEAGLVDPTLVDLAQVLGYAGVANLERCLYRRGDAGRAVIARLRPGYRSTEQISAHAYSTPNRRIRTRERVIPTPETEVA